MRVDHQLCTENALNLCRLFCDTVNLFIFCRLLLLFFVNFVIERFFFFGFFCLLDVIRFVHTSDIVSFILFKLRLN